MGGLNALTPPHRRQAVLSSRAESRAMILCKGKDKGGMKLVKP